MNKIPELEQQIKQAQDAYYNGEEILSDDEYDALVYELSTLDPTNKLLSKIGADATSKEWKKAKHLFPLGSLNKLNYPNEMDDWFENDISKNTAVVVEKLDGLSLGCQYDDGKLVKAILRGNGYEAEDIYKNLIKMKGAVLSLSDNFTGIIRGEIVLLKSDHKKFFPEYSNPRNAASGLCRRYDGVGVEHLTFMAYDILSENMMETEVKKLSYLKDNNFIIPNYKVCKSSLEINSMWKEYQDKIRSSLDYEIDGLVVSENLVPSQLSRGITALKPKGKIAFKFANQFVKTTVKKVEWQVGSSGRLTPVCWFDEVNLLGSKVQKASVYNISNIKKIGLGIGSDVLVCKANEIIPRVEKVISQAKEEIQIPNICPECNFNLEMNGEYLQCPNTSFCPAQKVGRIEKWVSELNILELGRTLIDRLVETGLVSDVADIYSLTIEQISSIDRMGEKSATNVYNSIHRYVEIPLHQFIGGLNIPLIGSASMKLITDAGFDNIDKLYKASVSEISSIKGIGPSKASSLIKGISDNKDLITKLLNNGIIIKSKTDGKLSGLNICLTGTMENKRSVLEKMIKDAGGNIKSSVGKDTSILIINEDSSSSKAIAAKKLGIKMIDEKQLLEMLK